MRLAAHRPQVWRAWYTVTKRLSEGQDHVSNFPERREQVGPGPGRKGRWRGQGGHTKLFRDSHLYPSGNEKSLRGSKKGRINPVFSMDSSCQSRRGFGRLQWAYQDEGSRGWWQPRAGWRQWEMRRWMVRDRQGAPQHPLSSFCQLTYPRRSGQHQSWSWPRTRWLFCVAGLRIKSHQYYDFANYGVLKGKNKKFLSV